jgi:NitT/TauT family transport system substrate-binding protein
MIIACLLAPSCQQKIKPSVEKVTIAVTLMPHSAPIFIANKKGYFAEEGLEVTLHPTMYGKIALEVLLAGDADFAGSAETPVMFASLKGGSFLVVAEVMNTDKDVGIFALRNRGVRSPDDLKGKKIGFPSGTSAHFFLDVFLAVHGISRGSVNTVQLKPDEMGSALRAGNVDAVAIFEPYIAAFKKEFGANATTFYETTAYLESWVMTARKKLVAERPEAVKKFLRSLLKAEAFIRGNPAETLDIVAQNIGKDRGDLEGFIKAFEFRVELDQSLMITLENQARWAIKSKLTDRTEVPNFLEYIYLDGLKAVKSDAVTIHR